jgi:hypothetical protein
VSEADGGGAEVASAADETLAATGCTVASAVDVVVSKA